MKLKASFGKIEEKDKIIIEREGHNFCTRVFRLGNEAIVVAEGPYPEMLHMIDILSYFHPEEVTLSK